MPQGSVLGPLLFLLFVNDIGIDINYSSISTFADDTKIAKKVNNHDDKNYFQKDINSLCEWAENWGMELNISKTKVMHLGRNNIKYEYKISDTIIDRTVEQKDLGIIIHDSLKWGPHILNSVKSANKILGLISRTLEYKSADTVIPLYKSLVRPILEYASQFWSPFLIKDIECLERVQRRATKLIPGIRNMSYENRLKFLNLTTLESRRTRCDLIQLYKILHGYDKIQTDDIFEIIYSSTRSNGSKIGLKPGRRYNTDLFKNFYFNRVIGSWNSLPEFVVESSSLSKFKSNFDKFILNGGTVNKFYSLH